MISRIFKGGNLFINRYSNILLRNMVLTVVIVCLSLVCLYQQSTINKLVENQMFTIVPPTLSGEAKVGLYTADTEYLKSMAAYLSLLFTNISAGNVDSQYSEILKLSKPSVFSVLKTKLKERANLIKRYPSISYSTNIATNISVVVSKGNILITLNKKKIVGNEVKDKVATVVSIDYEISNGKFSLSDINEVTKND